jgi:hypothetical protein
VLLNLQKQGKKNNVSIINYELSITNWRHGGGGLNTVRSQHHTGSAGIATSRFGKLEKYAFFHFDGFY